MPQEQSPPAPVVLIVENDVLLRLVTASNLRDAGFEVIEAANSDPHPGLYPGRCVVFGHRHAWHDERACTGGAPAPG
jgi:hypothetical protein